MEERQGQKIPTGKRKGKVAAEKQPDTEVELNALVDDDEPNPDPEQNQHEDGRGETNEGAEKEQENADATEQEIADDGHDSRGVVFRDGIDEATMSGRLNGVESQLTEMKDLLKSLIDHNMIKPLSDQKSTIEKSKDFIDKVHKILMRPSNKDSNVQEWMNKRFMFLNKNIEAVRKLKLEDDDRHHVDQMVQQLENSLDMSQSDGYDTYNMLMTISKSNGGTGVPEFVSKVHAKSKAEKSNENHSKNVS